VSSLATVAVDVPWPDQPSVAAVRQRLACRPFGRLRQLAEWLAGVQGRCPPVEFQRVRAVVFAGDHGIAELGVSAHPPGWTAAAVDGITAGTAAAVRLAELAGAGVRAVDVGVDADRSAPHRVRRGTGRIDLEDAMSADETHAAIAVGSAIADDEIDAGADLLVAAGIGVGGTTAASTLVAVLTGTEPAKVIGWGSGIDDAAWMRKTTAVRDARRRAMHLRSDPDRVLSAVGGLEHAALAGFLLQAAARRTPVLIDGTVSISAALVAFQAQPRAAAWWQPAQRGVDPAQIRSVDWLSLTPILDLGFSAEDGSGALIAVPILRAAVRVVPDRALPDV
jgi:nicotinate-nucleotide--dimethylbenzimidazole phosphoribosyltransferase